MNKLIIRRVLATVGGLLIIILSMFWAFYAAVPISEIFNIREGLPSEFVNGDAVYKKYSDLYTALSVVGLAIVAGFTFTLLLWERRPLQKRIQIVFWLLLLLAMPMTVINYWTNDTFVSRSQQAFLNFALFLLSVNCAVSLIKIKASSTSGLTIKCIALFFLIAQGVIVPAIYTVLWWLNWQSAISLATTRSISPGWISEVASIGSLIMTIMQFRSAKEKVEAPIS